VKHVGASNFASRLAVGGLVAQVTVVLSRGPCGCSPSCDAPKDHLAIDARKGQCRVSKTA